MRLNTKTTYTSPSISYVNNICIIVEKDASSHENGRVEVIFIVRAKFAWLMKNILPQAFLRWGSELSQLTM